MIKEYKKGKSFQLSKHFSSLEFDCHCKSNLCAVTLVDTDLVDALELLRKKVKPIHITSGYRDSFFNREIGGKPGSFHCTGKAVDCYVEGLDISSLYYYAIEIKAFRKGGIGIYPTWLHLDCRGTTSRWYGT